MSILGTATRAENEEGRLFLQAKIILIFLTSHQGWNNSVQNDRSSYSIKNNNAAKRKQQQQQKYI